jgi:hypothetical protein
MRRRLRYLAVWALATATTIGVSYWGIRSVLVAAAPERSAPLSAAELRHAAPSPTESPSPPPSPSPKPSPSPAAPTSPPPAPRSASPTPGWVSTPDARGGDALVRAFSLEGGQVTVFCNRGDVHVIGFTPAKGFTQSETRFSPDSLRINFSSEKHISRLWVTWRNSCYAEITESV